MANHVENYIRVKNCNQAVIDELQRIFSEKDDIGDTHTIDLVNGIYGKNWTNDDYDRGWMFENVGAKWVYGQIESEYENEIVINLTSAWDAVNPLLKQLCSKLICIKEDVVIENRFEDEGLDPMGVAYISSVYDSVEYLDEEVDVYKFYEDEEYREEVYEMLEELMDEERKIHQEVLDELKEERETYKEEDDKEIL
jgi:hypothetical protein